MKKNFSIVVAVDENFGIGRDNNLPWNLPGDLKHFKEVTTQGAEGGRTNAVIMGRKTWESIPEKFRPLPKRLNVVLSRGPQMSLPAGVLQTTNIDDALASLESNAGVDQIFVIGGGEIFRLAIAHPQCEKLYLTHIQKSFECDRFFPPLPAGFKQTDLSAPLQEADGTRYFFATYSRFPA